MATLNEVARLAGVTTATVSNVLRNTQKVKPATVQKVQAAIAATGYRPNLMARALAEGKSSMVALVVPDITNPFYPEFVAVAERVARDRNYFLMVCNTPQRPDIGRAYLSQITGTLAGGVLVLDTCITPEDVAQISNRRAHIVLASNEAIHYSDQVPHVVLDLHRAGEIAGQHLVALGHTCIGAIVGCGLAGRQIVRLGGFESALHAAGLTLLESNTRDTADTIAGGRAAAESLLEANPGITAIFATNDLMAYGAAQVLVGWHPWMWGPSSRPAAVGPSPPANAAVALPCAGVAAPMATATPPGAAAWVLMACRCRRSPCRCRRCWQATVAASISPACSGSPHGRHRCWATVTAACCCRSLAAR